MNNKTVLITGAAKRLGAAIATALHADGMDIIIHYNHSEAEAESLAKRLNFLRNNSAYTIHADLTNNDELNNLITESLKFKNSIDVLINNASSFYPTLIEETTVEQWDDLTNTNLKIPFFLSQAATPHLKKRHGCIINITDIHGQRPLKHHSAYSSAKAGLVMLTRALAKDLAPDIRVNAVAPGAILWPEDMDPETKDKILNDIPVGKAGDPADIASAVIFLINHADYITGEVIKVDGGRSLSL
jgi:pteridine reductase